jgi:hypothetical protein
MLAEGISNPQSRSSFREEQITGRAADVISV